MAEFLTSAPQHNAFEIAASLGEVRLQGMPQPNRGPSHASLVRVAIGRGSRGVVTLGERCRIIVPLTSESALATLAEDVKSAPVDMVEWRVDLYEPFRDASTPHERLAALHSGLGVVLERSPVPVLATIRTVDEGGLAALTPEEYAALVCCLAEQADAVDVQVFSPLSQAQVGELIREVRQAGAVAVGSNHDFDRTPHEEVVLGSFYAMKVLGVDVAKCAYRVDDPADALAVMNAQMRARSLLQIPVIGIGMGGAGALTRIAGSAIGCAATFAALQGVSAPGQFSVFAVREALDLLEG